MPKDDEVLENINTAGTNATGGVDIRTVEPGALLLLQDGTRVVVVENPADGVWLICKDLPDGSDEPEPHAEMTMVLCYNVAGPLSRS